MKKNYFAIAFFCFLSNICFSDDGLDQVKTDYITKINKILVFLNNQSLTAQKIIQNHSQDSSISPYQLIEECVEYFDGCPLILQTIKNTGNIDNQEKPESKKLSLVETQTLIENLKKNIELIKISSEELEKLAVAIKLVTSASQADELLKNISSPILIDLMLNGPSQNAIKSGVYSIPEFSIGSDFPPNLPEQIRQANYSVFFPSVALINFPEIGGSCTGALVSDNLVLTAAHCFCKPYTSFDNRLCQNKHIELGEFDNEKIEVVFQHEGQLSVQSITLNKKYQPNDSASLRPYDLALIELKELPRNIAHASLIDFDPKPGSLPATIVGFGDSYVDVNKPLTKKNGLKASAPLKIKLCNTKNQSTYICSSFSSQAQALTGHCPGDSGGPIFLSDQNGVFKIGGLITNGDDCEKSTGNMIDISFSNEEYKKWVENGIRALKGSLTTNNETSIIKLQPVNNKDDIFTPFKSYSTLSAKEGEYDTYSLVTQSNDQFIVIGVNASFSQIRPAIYMSVVDENNNEVSCLDNAKSTVEYAKFCKFSPISITSNNYKIKIKGTPNTSYQLVVTHLQKYLP